MASSFLDDREFTNRARKLLDRDFYPRMGRTVVHLRGSVGSMYLQKTAHIDAVVQVDDLTSVTVEEKIVRKKYNCFAVETHGDTRAETPNGWIHTSTADYLLYAFTVPDGLEAHLMVMPTLRRWFGQYGRKYHSVQVNNNWMGNQYFSQCSLVPIEDVPTKVYELRW